MANKSKSLSLPTVPADLLARVNAKAQLQGIDQPTFVIEALEEATKDLVEVQKRVQTERAQRKRIP